MSASARISARRKGARRAKAIQTACTYACAFIGMATALALVAINTFI
jgi:hypothetical protein